MNESSKPNLDLPSFSEKLPSLQAKLRESASVLRQLPKQQSCLPEWYSLYVTAHGLKGLVHLLGGSDLDSSRMNLLCEVLLCVLQEEYNVADYTAAALCFEKLANWQDSFESEIEKLHATFVSDLAHSQRLEFVPSNVPQINKEASKRFYEVHRLGLPAWHIQATLQLVDLPRWQNEVISVLNTTKEAEKDATEAFFIHFVPYVQAEGSTEVKVSAWLALNGHLNPAPTLEGIRNRLPQKTLVTKIAV